MAIFKGENKSGFFTRYRVTVGIVFLVVLAWCGLNFIKGHPFFAAMTLVFFFLSILLPKPSIVLVLVLAAFYIVRYSPSIMAIRAMQRVTNLAFSQPEQSLRDLFSPNSGLYVLPDQVELLQSIVVRYKLPDFRISADFQADYHKMQRIVESAWPVRISENSEFVFITPGESSNFTTCEVLEPGDEVILVQCP